MENVETIIGGGVDSYIIGEVEEDISLTPGSHISSCLNGLSPCVNDILTPNISIFGDNSLNNSETQHAEVQYSSDQETIVNGGGASDVISILNSI